MLACLWSSSGHDVSTFCAHGEVSVLRLQDGEVVFASKERLSLSPEMHFALQLPGEGALPRLFPIEAFLSLPVLPPLLYTARLGPPLADAAAVADERSPQA